MTPSHPAHPIPRDLVLRAVDQFSPALTGYAAGITGDHDAARDVVQDTFLRLCTHENPASLDGPGLKAWLFTVCRHRAIDWLRRHRRLVSTDPHDFAGIATEAPQPADSAAAEDDASAILQLLQKLPRNQSECLRLKFQHDLSYREIAAATGLSVTNVGFLIHTGLRRLRERLSHLPEYRKPALCPSTP
jgi:RNA polymerase sigma-70 factor (ECF subfamily)